jgi:DNA-binding transcriptional ArsR family regulator
MDDSDVKAAGVGAPHHDATPQPLTSEQEHELAKAVALIATAPNVLDVAVATLRELGVAGEDRLLRILYLVLTSRVLDRPASAIVKGHSSGGKSFLVKSIRKLFPPSAYWLRSGVSPKLIVYTSESFVNRVLIIEEVASLNRETETFLRLLLSEGNLVYSTLEQAKSETGENIWKEATHTKRGPAGLVITTTNLSIHAENETRMLSLSITDSREQTKNAMRAAARVRGVPTDTTAHQLFQEWISKQPAKVRIPYIARLAEEMSPAAVRIRRDFNTVISLIEAHALIHQMNRKRDSEGAVIATIEDYAAVYELVADIISYGVDASAPATVRETVKAVQQLLLAHPEGVTAKALAAELGLDKSNASRRLDEAEAGGYLEDLEEKKKGKPRRVVIGEPLPDGDEILPHPNRIADGCAVAPVSMGDPAEEPQQ